MSIKIIFTKQSTLKGIAHNFTNIDKLVSRIIGDWRGRDDLGRLIASKSK